MKQKLLRLIFLSTILCTLFAVGSFATAGKADAATLQAHTSQASANILRVLCTDNAQVEFYTDYNGNTGLSTLVCFEGSGQMNVGLYNVQTVWTGNYTVAWTWIDCNGNQHESLKGPHTQVTATNSPGRYAGCYVMSKIIYIALS